MIIWDFNIVVGNSGSDSGSGNLFSINYGDSGMSKLYNEPAYTRYYLQALKEIAAGPLNITNAGPVLDARYAAFKANGVNVTAPTSIKSWINQQQKAILTYMTNFTVSFAVANAGNTNITVDSNVYTLSGTAPLEVKTIKINGLEYPLLWDSFLFWHVRVPLAGVTNQLVVQGFYANGSPVPGASNSVSVVSTKPVESPLGKLVINEILYSPARPGAGFVEIHNVSTHSYFDLSGWKLSAIDYTFPIGTMVDPGAYILVVQDRQAFLASYPASGNIVGEYKKDLLAANGPLTLLAPGSAISTSPASTAVVVDEVNYQLGLGWPQTGEGSSLQFNESAQDNSVASNWGAVTSEQAENSGWHFASATGTVAENPCLLIYHSPLQVLPDPMDLKGQWSGTISFTGMEYNMTLSFDKTADGQWEGTFTGADVTTRLTNIKTNQSAVTFELGDLGSGVNFVGKISTNGTTLSGTFSEPTDQGTITVPFKTKRLQDKSIVWGGDCYIDDLMLVAGKEAERGENLVSFGDFENSLDGNWMIASNHLTTGMDSGIMHSGGGSLRLVASRGGEGKETAVSRVLTGLASGQTFTLSYWYKTGSAGNDLTIGIENSSILSTRSLKKPAMATPGQPNVLSSEMDPPVRILGIQLGGNKVLRLVWRSVPNKRYQIQINDSFTGSNWQNWESPKTATAESTSIEMPNTLNGCLIRIQLLTP